MKILVLAANDCDRWMSTYCSWVWNSHVMTGCLSPSFVSIPPQQLSTFGLVLNHGNRFWLRWRPTKDLDLILLIRWCVLAPLETAAWSANARKSLFIIVESGDVVSNFIWLLESGVQIIQQIQRFDLLILPSLIAYYELSTSLFNSKVRVRLHAWCI